jgi:SAM-dependent methyltransferase
MNQSFNSDPRCPICHSRAEFAFRSPYQPVTQCQHEACRHLFVDGPSEGAGVQSHDTSGEARMYADRNVVLMDVLVSAGIVGPNLRVLDFGSGSGHVAGAVRRAFPTASVTCVEADADARAHLTETGLPVASSLTEAGEGYDSVLLIEVIEHVSDPVTLLEGLRDVLRPGGRMLVTTPVGETRRGSRKTNAYETAEHIQFFTERSLELAVAQAGLRPFEFRVINELYPRSTALAGRALGVMSARGRQLWSLLFGYRHLVGFTEVPE